MSDFKNDENPTNFGFTKVSFKEKQRLVQSVFDQVASKYDLMNDVMSMGVHRLWKDKFAEEIPNLNSSILDVAGGSGDIAFRLLSRAKAQGKHPQMTICDINSNMLKVAMDKGLDKNLLSNINYGINYVCADAQRLPFASNSFDYYTIAFGIRNVPRIDLALKEAYRVLKPGGKFLCLEFSKIKPDCLKPLYNFYSFNVIPKLGSIFAKNADAYKYLVESINLFPSQEEFASMIKEAGFSDARYKDLSFGVAAIHSGYKS